MAVSLTQGEARRHFAMNCCLIAGAVVAGTAITNERGVFSPIGFNPFSATVKAFEALAGAPVGDLRQFGMVPAVVPISRLGAPGPLRRGLVNALNPAPVPYGAVPGAGPLGGPYAPGAGIVGPGGLVPEEFGGSGFVPSPGVGPVTVPNRPTTTVETTTPVPEPALWTLLVAGFGLIGGALRRPRRRAAA